MSYCVIVIVVVVVVAVAGVPHPLAATVAVAIKMSAHASLLACNYRAYCAQWCAPWLLLNLSALKLNSNSTQLS